MYTIITSFNQKYWKEVAEDSSIFLDKHWPKNSEIVFYHELSEIPKTNYSNRVSWIDLYESCPDIIKFSNKWKDHPKANGNQGSNFRLNAIKFVHKTFAIWHRSKIQRRGWVVWLDCDALIYKSIDKNFINTVFNEKISIAYVGRPGKYSECGFLAFNLNHPDTHAFLNEWEALYLSGDFINLPETHDSWTFDYIKNKRTDLSLFLNLNAGTETNKNPFGNSKLGPYISHAKGENKAEQLSRLKNKLLS